MHKSWQCGSPVNNFLVFSSYNFLTYRLAFAAKLGYGRRSFHFRFERIYMPVRSRSSRWVFASALSWRVVAQRFSFVLFIMLACALLIFGRVQPAVIENVRVHAIDMMAPVLDAIARPMTATENVLGTVHSYFGLRAENEKLKASNTQLQQWQNAVVTLQNENRELQNLLHFKAEPGIAYISARVIADTGGPFVRGLIVTAGKLDGVREGMAAMTGDGLIGRVVEAGDWSSRILLITDLSSRIPVTIMGSGDRAILAGDNSAQPKLMYLPLDAVLTPGARVVTSGHGGIFPADLPIGAVNETSKGSYSLVPLADLGRVNYVRLVDFNLKGGAFNPIATKVQSETKKH
jgi:rod shape-determining protein MreC